MTELLKALHDAFYEPRPEKVLKLEVETAHQQLAEVLGKSERRLLLEIIDAKDRITDDISFDSFVTGFRLGYQLTTEVGMYKGETDFAV